MKQSGKWVLGHPYRHPPDRPIFPQSKDVLIKYFYKDICS